METIKELKEIREGLENNLIADKSNQYMRLTASISTQEKISELIDELIKTKYITGNGSYWLKYLKEKIEGEKLR